MASSRFKLLTTDATLTLIKIRFSVGHHYNRVAKQFGIQSYNEASLTDAFYIQYAQMSREHPNFGCTDGTLSTKNWWKLVMQRSFMDTAKDYDETKMEPVLEKLYKEFSTPNCWELFPDVKDTLPKLKKKGLLLGIVSNNDERLPDLLHTGFDILKYFPVVVLSSEVQSAKPNAEIFQIAMKKAGVKPQQSVHVGDNVDLDYKAARDVGMAAYLIDREGKYKNCSPKGVDKHHILKDFVHLNQILA
ncbi:haloacid dehalogenase-like hydrolase domain-containing protein 3 [Saccoglossus kowalevskii]|uniref:Haloacid dehalogenase-like hydrolase domain-containing protein 3-like n=1 Tax=Saccoglossus kowalevskii TaxID=10224 RepID=A0ABM0GQX6_SACKO|nr:PREDICTED: haloacid dehalogenase-like hydrolase domain-containing protein 3-like [Saccoglossus kowalevskii]